MNIYYKMGEAIIDRILSTYCVKQKCLKTWETIHLVCFATCGEGVKVLARRPPGREGEGGNVGTSHRFLRAP